MTRAVVLSGGGTVGIAWQSGIVAGLAEGGVDLREADLIVGTSAGAVVGAQLALQRSPLEMYERQLVRRDGPRPAPPPRNPADVAPLIAAMARAQASGGQRSAQDNLAMLGALALSASTISEEDFVAGFGTRITEAREWPRTRFICTAIDTSDGSFVSWDSASGVDLARAVAASCAVPAVFPPVTINERRYMDGGMRSSTNADLASGHESVLIIALSGAGDTPLADSRAETARKRLLEEIDGLRAAGAGLVEVIGPDEGGRAAIGTNLMDYARNPEAATDGLRQGRLEAERLRTAWAYQS